MKPLLFLNSETIEIFEQASNRCRARAQKWVKHNSIFRRNQSNEVAHERERFHGRMVVVDHAIHRALFAIGFHTVEKLCYGVNVFWLVVFRKCFHHGRRSVVNDVGRVSITNAAAIDIDSARAMLEHVLCVIFLAQRFLSNHYRFLRRLQSRAPAFPRNRVGCGQRNFSACLLTDVLTEVVPALSAEVAIGPAADTGRLKFLDRLRHVI